MAGGTYMARGVCGRGQDGGGVGVCDRRHVWRGGACVTRGHAWQRSIHGRRDSHCSGQYASYWNAFLSVFRYISIISRSSLSTKVMVSNSTMKKNVIFTSCFACVCGCIPLNIDQKFSTFEVSIVSMAKYKNLSCRFLSANVINVSCGWCAIYGNEFLFQILSSSICLSLNILWAVENVENRQNNARFYVK